MITSRFFLNIGTITIIVSCIQWMVIGVLMHKYQELTPGVWKTENKKSYMASTAADLLFAIFFTFIFLFWIKIAGKPGVATAIKGAVVCWLAFSVAAEINSFIYINYDRRFFLGKLVSSLLEYTSSAIISVLIL